MEPVPTDEDIANALQFAFEDIVQPVNPVLAPIPQQALDPAQQPEPTPEAQEIEPEWPAKPVFKPGASLENAAALRDFLLQCDISLARKLEMLEVMGKPGKAVVEPQVKQVKPLDDGREQRLEQAAAIPEVRRNYETLRTRLDRELEQLEQIKLTRGQDRIKSAKLARANALMQETTAELKKATQKFHSLCCILQLPKDVLRMILEKTRFVDQLHFAQVCRQFRYVYNIELTHPVHGLLLPHRFIYVIRTALDPICGKVLKLDRFADEFNLHTQVGRFNFVDVFGLPRPAPKKASSPSPKSLDDLDAQKAKLKKNTLFKYMYNAQYSRVRRTLLDGDRSVKEMTIDQDQPAGHIPFEIAEYANLVTLSIINTLAPTVPPALCRLAHLRNLDLNRNKIVAFPIEFWTLTQLDTLDLSGNLLDELPPAVGMLTRLRVLNLSSNQLTTLPPQIGMLTGLRGSFLLENNQLKNLPATMHRLTGIRALYLEDNWFDTFPVSVCPMTNLTSLCLLKSKGAMRSIPDEICGLLNLTRFEMSGPFITHVSSAITLLNNLRYLDVRCWDSKVLDTFNNEELQFFLSWYHELHHNGCHMRFKKGFMAANRNNDRNNVGNNCHLQ